jgi:hypothetical protein
MKKKRGENFCPLMIIHAGVFALLLVHFKPLPFSHDVHARGDDGADKHKTGGGKILREKLEHGDAEQADGYGKPSYFKNAEYLHR